MRESQVLEVVRSDGPITAEVIAARLYPDLIEELVPRARQSVHAHLRKLVVDGEVATKDPDDESGEWAVP